MASVTGWSLVQSPAGCVCLIVCDLESPKRGGLGPIWAVAPRQKPWHKPNYEINHNQKIYMLTIQNTL
jgi:hypothetical protein